MRTYPNEMTPRSPQWFALLADLDSGQDELEPHQIPGEEPELPCLLRRQAS